LAKELSGDLDNILHKALAKLPSQRYVSAEALSQDLLCYLRGRPVLARGESLGYRFRKYMQRHRWSIAAAATILLVLTTALGVVAWQAQRALREAARAQAMQRFIAELFQDAGSSPNTPIDLRSLLDMGILRGEHSLARQPQARAELYGVVAQLRLSLGDYREADELLQRQSILLATLPDVPFSLHIESATLRGNVQRQLGDTRSCVELMRPLELRVGKEESRLPQQAAAYYAQLGRCLREQSQPDAAKRLFVRALELRRKQNDDSGVAEATLDMASLEADAGHPAEALQTIALGLDRLRQRAGEHHPEAIDMLRSMCSLERITDALDAAVRDCRRSLKLAQELHGPNHRTAIDANRQLAALYVDMGRLSEAETIFLDTTAWMRTRLDPNHPDMARAYNSLAIVAWERSDDARALRFQKQAVAAWRKTGNKGLLAGGLFNYAMILLDDGQAQAALLPAQESAALRVKQFNARHELVGDSERLIGEINTALGQYASARVSLEKAVAQTRAGYGPEHSHTRRAEVSLAHLLALEGRPEALDQLDMLGRLRSTGMEQRKAAWLARAYAAQQRCTLQPQLARVALEATLAEMQLAVPEGGAVTREVQRIRNACGRPSQR
jgi:serine/threonine-protein kinase